MSKKIPGLVLLLALFGLSLLLINCGSSSSRPAGVLYVLSQGENNVGSFAIDLTSGGLSLINKTAKADVTPSSILLDPAGTVVYVLNTGSNTITSYTANSDGSLTAQGTPTAIPVQNSVAMARDAAGTFLAVVSQGAIPLPSGAGTKCPHAEPNSDCPHLSIFSTQSGSASLSLVGTPFPLDHVPTSVAASITGSFNDPSNLPNRVDGTLIHITGNQDLSGNIDNVVSEFVVQASGAVTGPLLTSAPYTTQSSPSSVLAIQTTPTGAAGGLFVYIANTTTGNLDIYQVCTVENGSNCLALPDDVHNARMNRVGTPISVGLNPVAMTADPTNNFLYVVNHDSSTVSAFRINPTAGTLSPLTPSSVSTGGAPIAITMHSSGKFLFVSNNASSNLSGFNVSTTNGALSNAVNVTSSAQPAGLVAK